MRELSPQSSQAVPTGDRERSSTQDLITQVCMKYIKHLLQSDLLDFVTLNGIVHMFGVLGHMLMSHVKKQFSFYTEMVERGLE